jgi:hypothetical protein
MELLQAGVDCSMIALWLITNPSRRRRRNLHVRLALK